MMDPDNIHYLLGSSVGPHPYPVMVRDFQKIISHESRKQILKAEGKLPESVIACVGGGSNAIGAFYEFIPDKKVKLIAVEPAGKGTDTKRHGLALAKGKTSVIHGYKTLVLQDDRGNIEKSYSAASGLDYPGVGPELSCLKKSGRIICASATDKQAVDAMILLSETEGIIPALESAHAISYAMYHAKTLPREDSVIVNLSGRGDKDVEHIYESLVK
jgi:tryptophan synthase beta chain